MWIRRRGGFVAGASARQRALFTTHSPYSSLGVDEKT
jgi:hypothetical protein